LDPQQAMKKLPTEAEGRKKKMTNLKGYDGDPKKEEKKESWGKKNTKRQSSTLCVKRAPKTDGQS